jgi:hypothetical protein
LTFEHFRGLPTFIAFAALHFIAAFAAFAGELREHFIAAF